MAYEGIREYTDKLKAAYQSKPSTQTTVILLMADYLETTLRHNKFKEQRRYHKSVMEELDPAFCKGYFKKSKTKTDDHESITTTTNS